ncbi:MAG: tRNA pseudouridine(55) synthase TruB [bacterium]
MKHGTLHEPEGIWLIDKPYQKSSFWVVGQMRRLTGIRKIGHAGTLDPLATGLLLILVGKEFTRQADSLLKLDKTYSIEITLGAFSTTDDAEGELTPGSDSIPTHTEVAAAIASLTGEIKQVPPQFSAIKVGGKRAYKMARSGQEVTLTARPVTVYDWKNLDYTYPYIRADVAVSSGTYIRSLARDLGKKLETGAYITGLRRTKIDSYSVDEAQVLENILPT